MKFFTITLVNRESNTGAGLPANITVDQSNPPVIYDNPPTPLYATLFEDNVGVVWPLFIHDE